MKIYSPEHIEKYILSVLKNPIGMDLCLKQHFLNRNLIKNEFEDMHDSDLLFDIKILKKYNIIPNIEEKILLEQIRDKNFVSYNRITSWEISDIGIIDSINGNIPYGIATAKFHLQNKWNIIGVGYWHKIIFDKNNLSIVWADLGNDTDLTINNFEYTTFVSNNNIVYKLDYVQPTLYILLNPCKEKELDNFENKTLDKFINTECKETINSGYGFIMDTEFAKIAELNKSVERKFFENGPNWEYGKCCMYNGKTATELNRIYNKNNTIYFELENNTFNPQKIQRFYINFENNIVGNESTNKEIIIEDYEIII
jgi:hypothetical protein